MGNLFAGIIAGITVIIASIAAKKAIADSASSTRKSVYMKDLLRHYSKSNPPLTDVSLDETEIFSTEEECLHYLSTLLDGDKYIIVKSKDETEANDIEEMQEYGFTHVSRTGYMPIELVDKNGNYVTKGTKIQNTMGAEGIVSSVTVMFSVCFEDNSMYHGIPEFIYNLEYEITLSDYKRNSASLPNLKNENCIISMDTFRKYWFIKGADK